MFFFFFDNYFKSERELEIFVSNALMVEAKKEKRKIEFNKTINNTICDIYLSEGLQRFTEHSDIPTVVEVKLRFVREDVVRKINEYRKNDNFIGKIVFIINDDVEEKELPFDKDYDTLILGRKTINELIEIHKDVLTNSLISDENISFDFSSDNEVVINDKRKDNINNNRQKYKISKDMPQKISDLNEDDFKIHFHSDPSKCALILGNGISIPFGSDNWAEMIHNMLTNLNPYFIKDIDSVEDTLSHSNYAISSFVKTTLFSSSLEDKYYDSLRYSIYHRYNDLMHDDMTLVKVIAEAKHKYQSLPILTYNYDTFVERQYYKDYHKDLLYYCGYDYMSHINNHIIHLHGYISYTFNYKDGIILTDEEYYDTYETKRDNWVVDAQETFLRNNKVLFVGSSISDLFQLSIINKVKKMEGSGWYCYALIRISPDKIGLRGTIKILEFYQKKGIRIIFTDSFDKMPTKLNNILLK